MPAPENPKPNTDPRNAAPQARRTRIMTVAAMALAGLALVVAVIPRQGGVGEEAVRRFIAENPQFIIDTLNQHVLARTETEREQTINIVKAGDAKTVLGNPDGDVTIYEFTDYNCGYCKRVFSDLMEIIDNDGNIRLVIKEFPILSEESAIAARHALAVAEMGRFEEFHKAAMAWEGRIDQDAVNQIVAGLGIDQAALEARLADGGIDKTISENRRIARELNLTGTPAFIIGRLIIPGAIGKAEISRLVERARDEADKS